MLASAAFSATVAFITETFGWFYMLAVAFFLVFLVAIAFSNWGHIKLGPDHSDPEYSFPSWDLWRRRLQGLVTLPQRREAEAFIDTTAHGAMQQVQRELINQGWDAAVHLDDANHRIPLKVTRDNQIDFVYEIRLIDHVVPEYVHPEPSPATTRNPPQYSRAEVFLRHGGQSYDVYGFDQQDLITNTLDQFEKYLYFLHISPGTLPWKTTDHDDIPKQEPEQMSSSPTEPMDDTH